MTAKPSGDSSKQQVTEPLLSRQLEGQELADIVARDVKAKNGYRASKTPAPLMVMSPPGSTAPTRLDRWQAVASWTIWEAAMLLHGFDPGPIGGAARTQESLLGRPTQAGTIEPKPKAAGLCGQWFIGERHFWPVLEVVDAWRREPDATEKVSPARFIKWCKQRGFDTGWLRTIKEDEFPTLAEVDAPIASGAGSRAHDVSVPRGADGVLTLLEIVDEVLALSGASPQNAWAIQREALWQRVQKAAEDGHLRVRHPDTLLSEVFKDWPSPSSADLVCTVSDINAWLEADGMPHRLQVLSTGETPPTHGACRLPAHGSDLDPSPLATRKQLIINHTTKQNRTSSLNAVISKARSRATDGTDWMSAWNELVAMAKADDRPAPLLGYTEGEGIKYQADKAESPVAFLSRDAFRKRVGRAK